MEAEGKKRLSKQEKKKLKAARTVESKKVKREKRRELKKGKRKEMLERMSVGSAYAEERKEYIHEERRHTEAVTAEIQRVAVSGSWLVVDCSYSDLMSELEQGSLISQVEQGVSMLHKEERQFFKVILAGVTGRVQGLFVRQHADRWPADVIEGDVMEIPGIQEKTIVMLSPDAEEALTDLDLSTEAYVIGGLVDRTHKKAASLSKALERKVAVRRFPIQETIDPVLPKQRLNLVLNINVVMHILHLKASGLSWTDVFEAALPQRQKKILGKIQANYDKQTAEGNS